MLDLVVCKSVRPGGVRVLDLVVCESVRPGGV